ncbi:hypothetical protein SPRG_02492 [Saprolegnia parasitica CBS 223.65]|uniref:PSI domain-containing protein n=1 Tax=Saprolegnia parasitica (strain CBS 223.65) TaxID=695850 RepID=A0A067CQ36_SAPPC|nr:hypothetical protein SPRG_02492 [Saprolegnia parasitica CBS 223.65]KDO32794.1 hypothetical protein SPRG_02492 [Saprolegnia parasitica CBS 223.65]|eukprot:XP_012196456.1 hypothetical protein SPRG_02492 [Saprolegnia parasitica CBS 223.65]
MKSTALLAALVVAVLTLCASADPKLRSKLGDQCHAVGDCLPCAKSEANENWCRGTGHKQELLCKSETANTTVYERCIPPAANQDFSVVLTFEAAMCGILALASVLLAKEKKKHMSSFDLRKDPRQPSKPFQT